MLKRRADFLAMRQAPYAHSKSLVLQARKRGTEETRVGGIRTGYTVTKKNGNAVERNRIKRRLREAMRLCIGEKALAGHDYVVVGKRHAINNRFSDLVADMSGAFERVHSVKAVPGKIRGKRGSGIA